MSQKMGKIELRFTCRLRQAVAWFRECWRGPNVELQTLQAVHADDFSESFELAAVSTDELVSELVRRNLRTVVVMEAGHKGTPDGDASLRVQFGGPEGETHEEWFEGHFATVDLLARGQELTLAVIGNRVRALSPTAGTAGPD